MKAFKPGDRVTWHSAGEHTIGKIKAVLTTDCELHGHLAKATMKAPLYIVVSESGRQELHRPEALEALPDDYFNGS